MEYPLLDEVNVIDFSRLIGNCLTEVSIVIVDVVVVSGISTAVVGVLEM